MKISEIVYRVQNQSIYLSLSDKIPPQTDFYLRRPDGTISALVEVDQLPPCIEILGIMKSLPECKTAKMKYICKGLHGKQYSVTVIGNGVDFQNIKPKEQALDSISLKKKSNFVNDFEVFRRNDLSNATVRIQASSLDFSSVSSRKF